MRHVLLLAACISLPTFASSILYAPHLYPNESWELRTVDGYNNQKEIQHLNIKVKGFRNGLVLYDVDNGKTQFVSATTWELNPLTQDASGKMTPIRKYQWPLETGQQYSYEINQSQEHMQGTVVVGGTEKVSTPAGEFNAVKLTVHGVWHTYSDRGAGGRWNLIEWYAPQVDA